MGGPRKQTPLSGPQKERSPVEHLRFSPRDRVRTSDLELYDDECVVLSHKFVVICSGSNRTLVQ